LKVHYIDTAAEQCPGMIAGCRNK